MFHPDTRQITLLAALSTHDTMRDLEPVCVHVLVLFPQLGREFDQELPEQIKRARAALSPDYCRVFSPRLVHMTVSAVSFHTQPSQRTKCNRARFPAPPHEPPHTHKAE